METISYATYFSARTQLLNTAQTYLRWARDEPERREHFLSWRKSMQRHLAQIRCAKKVHIL